MHESTHGLLSLIRAELPLNGMGKVSKIRNDIRLSKTSSVSEAKQLVMAPMLLGCFLLVWHRSLSISEIRARQRASVGSVVSCEGL